VKRVKGLQTGNVNNIKVILYYPTSNPDILERVVHYVLDRYRCNSNREFFDCDVEHIKRVVRTAGSMIDTLKSCYQHISIEEFEQKLSTKIGVDIDNECEEAMVEGDFEQGKATKKSELWTWLEENIEYKENNILELKSVCDLVSSYMDIVITNKQKNKIKLEIQDLIRSKFLRVNHEHQYTHFNNTKYRGWLHFGFKNDNGFDD
jgi:hypothetical protein